MLRDKNLIPLSHQHQRALALCVRIDRASPIPDANLNAWQTEIAQLFRTEIGVHFLAEERVLFPAAGEFGELAPLVRELQADHEVLRGKFAQAESRNLCAKDLLAFAQRLSLHIRREERHLFERLQALLNKEELAALGRRLDDALKDASPTCTVPTDATRLRAAK